MSNTTTYETGERVRLRAVRQDIEVTVIGQEGPLVAIRVDATGQVVNVPADVLYR